jgi:hypothetical protein
LRDVPPPPPAAAGPAPLSGVPGLPPGGWGFPGSGGTAAQPAKSVPVTDPEYIRQMEQAYDQQHRAYGGQEEANRIMAKAEAQKGAAGALGALQEKQAIQTGKFELEQGAKERKKQSDEYLRRIDEVSAKLADEKVEKPSTFDNVRWTIAGMLGAIQQGMLHLPTNQIADRIQQNIQNDVERQKIEFERHKGRKEDLNSLYAKAYAATGDDMEATKLANGLGLEMAKKETQSLVSAADSDIARTRGDVLNAAIETKKAELAGQEAETEIKLHKYTPATAATGPSVDQKALVKRIHEITDKGAEHGVDVTPQDAYRRAYMEQTGRDPWAQAKGIAPVAYAKGGGGLPASTPDAQSLASIGKLPEKQQKDALEEFNKRKAANQALSFGRNIFNTYQNKATEPGAFSRIRDVDSDTMALELKGQLGPGFASDKDFDTLKTYMPQPNDAPETLAHKRQMYEGFIARHGQTPILDAYGIAPKTGETGSGAATAAAAGAKPMVP